MTLKVKGESVLNGLRRQLLTSRALNPEYSLAIRGFCLEQEQGALRAARIQRNDEGRFGSRISQRQLQGRACFRVHRRPSSNQGFHLTFLRALWHHILQLSKEFSEHDCITDYSKFDLDLWPWAPLYCRSPMKPTKHIGCC